jgi:hypothetical protein
MTKFWWNVKKTEILSSCIFGCMPSVSWVLRFRMVEVDGGTWKLDALRNF